MAFSEIELKRIDTAVGALCRDRSPKQYADQLRFVYEVAGHSIEIWEERPGWNDPSVWTRMGVAKFRYIKSKKLWKLYWMRRDLKWHSYDPEASNATTLEQLVRIVAEDRWGAFFG